MRCEACRCIKCEDVDGSLEITDRLTNIIEVRPEESVEQCAIRNKYFRKSEIIYEKGNTIR